MGMIVRIAGTVMLLAAACGAQGAEFASALDAAELIAVVDADPIYNHRPLTVELWCRLRDKAHYNILIANETKASQTHWEVFTEPGSGRLAAYVPGNTPDHVRATEDIVDGLWHHVALTLDGDSMTLHIDGRKVAEESAQRPADLQTVAGPLHVGSLVEQILSCDGEVAAVRISSVVRDVRVPSPDLATDEHTLALWRFDRPRVGEQCPDAGAGGRAATYAAAPKTMDRIDIYALTTAEAGELHKSRQVPGGRSLAIPPPEVDLAETRRELLAALKELPLECLARAADTRDGVLVDWEEQYYRLGLRVRGEERLPAGSAEQVYDKQALVTPQDGDPAGVVLRRVGYLLRGIGELSEAPDIGPMADALQRLEEVTAEIPMEDTAARKRLFLLASALQRKIAFANPLLDFDKILFVARGNYLGSRVTGPTTTTDAYGQHFATQYYAFNSVPGGGLFAVEDFKGEPRVVDLLKDSIVERGRLAGRKLDPGAFISPDLSFDGKQIVFGYTENREHKWVWSPETTWNLFSANVDGSGLAQLTDSQCNDFDPCWLPNGRVAFISERRGGYIRCFALLHVPNYVLHSMKADGSDVFPLSYYETSEWHPSVNNDGMLVYTRWDYTDRENCLGSNFWICNPDGRDPRAPHGNYPYPWHTFADNTHGDSRSGRPYVEMSIRAVPGSHKYVMTAAPHHGEAFGALVMLDLRVPDDGHMSQLRRITPYAPFPETEFAARSQYPYGTPWPLSEDFYLCNWWENLYLLDRWGNRVLLCENELVFGQTNYDMRLIDPIPLKPRPTPPVVRTETNQGEDRDTSAPVATVSVVNVYDSELPFPEGAKIRWLRVLQNILKLNPWMGVPMVGYQNENTPRIPLGIVPVEEDGSIYFEAPVERGLIFQALDENYMAVQSMRSAAYVHPGEQLTCLGCHEHPQKATTTRGETPLALRRAPSTLEPEVGSVEPVTYYRLVKPVFERSCIPCHQEQGKGPVDMSYQALEPYAFYFAGGMSRTTMKPVHGGSRTIPGRFGARSSRLGQALLDENHRGKVSQEDYRRVVLWLDANSPRLGAYHDVELQEAGEVVWPTLDVDPTNPQGLERLQSASQTAQS